ncbi:metallophosphoesterase family protein [Desulfobacula sp.]
MVRSNNKKIHYIIPAISIIIGISVFLFPYFFTPPRVVDWNYLSLKNLKIETTTGDTHFSFAVFGDNKNSLFTFNRVIEDINNEDISFSVETGDLIDNVIDGNSEYKIYLNQIRKLVKPLFVIPGNHETEGISSAYYYLFGSNYYAFPYKNSYFIMLDGSHETGLGPWQLQWLKKELQHSLSYANRFVFMHIPLYDPQEGEYTAGHSITDKNVASDLNNLFDKYNVTMVFTAHKHGLFQGKWHKTPFTITGGAGAELGGTDKNHYFNHYILVDVNNNGVTYEIKKIRGPASNIIFLFSYNVREFMSMYFMAHWDLLLIMCGGLYLLVALFYGRKAS